MVVMVQCNRATAATAVQNYPRICNIEGCYLMVVMVQYSCAHNLRGACKSVACLCMVHGAWFILHGGHGSI